MGHWGTYPLDFQLFIFYRSLQSCTNSHIRLHGVAQPIRRKKYTGIQLCNCLLHELRNIFVHRGLSPLNYFSLVSCLSSQQILAKPLESEKRCDLRRQQKMERGGSSDVRWKTVNSTDERLRQETLCRRQWTDEYVEHPETLTKQNVVVVWIQCLPVVRHTGTLASVHVDICTPKLRP